MLRPECNDEIALEQGGIRWLRQWRGTIHGSLDRLPYRFVSIATSDLHSCDNPTRHLRDPHLALQSGFRARRSDPGTLDLAGDHADVLRHLPARTRRGYALFGSQLRIEFGFARDAGPLGFGLELAFLLLFVAL